MLSRLVPAPGGGHADRNNLVGRPAGRQDLNAAERTLIAAAWIRAAADALEASRDRLGAAVPAGPVNIGLLDRHLRHVAEAPAGREVAEIAADLSVARATGGFRPIESGDRIATPLVVVTDRRALSLARIAHRTLGLQGPWGCVAKASRTHHGPPMELLSADATVVPLAEQIKLADAILSAADRHTAALDPSVAQWLGREMTRTYVDSWRPPEWGFPRPAGTHREELGSLFLDRAVTDVEALQIAADRAVQPFLAGRAPSATLRVDLVAAGPAPGWPLHVATPLPQGSGGTVSVTSLSHDDGSGSVHVLAGGNLAESVVIDRIVESIERALS